MTTRKQRSRALAAQPAPAPKPAPEVQPFVPTEDTPRLHYRGDRTGVDPRRIYGPDAFGAIYRSGAAEYDAAADRTTIYFRPIAPPKRVLA